MQRSGGALRNVEFETARLVAAAEAGVVRLPRDSMLLLRRARGVLGTALVWAMAWLVIGSAVGLHAGVRTPTPGAARFVAWMAAGWALWGAVSGALFALAVLALERRRTLAQLSIWRVATWGALGALALPAAFLCFVWGAGGSVTWQGVVVTLPTSAALGAGCAASTLALAQRNSAAVGDGSGRAA